MIFNLTYRNPEAENIINDIGGKPFSFIEALKIGSIGSKRMIIKNISPNLSEFSNSYSDNKYCNIEIRRNGIIIYVNISLKNYAWVIPYRSLVIYKTNNFSIHANGKFITLLNNNMLRDNKKFFNLLFKLKTKCQENYIFHI